MEKRKKDIEKIKMMLKKVSFFTLYFNIVNKLVIFQRRVIHVISLVLFAYLNIYMTQKILELAQTTETTIASSIFLAFWFLPMYAHYYFYKYTPPKGED